MSSLACFLTVQLEAFSSASCTCLFTWPASSGCCCVNSAHRTSARVMGKSHGGGGFCDIVLILSPAHPFGARPEARPERSCDGFAKCYGWLCENAAVAGSEGPAISCARRQIDNPIRRLRQ